MTLPPPIAGSAPGESHPPSAPDLPYHRLARIRPRYRWWRMLITGLVGIGLYIVMMLLVIVPVGVVSALDPAVSRAIDESLTTTAYFDLDRPWLFLVLVVPLILMIPALLLASRIVEGRGVGFLSSVAGRLRWGWLWRTLLLALAVFTVSFAVVFAVDAFAGERFEVRLDHPGLPLIVVLVLVLIPFQAAAEEYVFRGYLMQLIGGWLRHPAFAIVLPVPLFVLGHLYDVWGLISVGVFAVVAAWISWRTGGLEAAIALHIVNNVAVFLLGAVGLVDANASTGTPGEMVTMSVTVVVYALIVDRWARARSLSRETYQVALNAAR